jgi:hypothetical protein
VFAQIVIIASAASLCLAVPASAAVRFVAGGQDLQAVLDAAQPGDTILLEAGATFRGNFLLPAKNGAVYITLRSSADDRALPPEGVRITPAYAALLPKLESGNAAPVLRTAAGAHHWRLAFLELRANLLGYGEILRIGDGSSAQSQLSQVPYAIDVDRVYVHGHPLHGQKRGIALNGRQVTIRNSYVSDIKAVAMDAQAIGGWNGPGPFTIENNYLEASGENFLLGGSDPAIVGLVSEQVVVRRNHMSRPMAWKDPIVPAPAGLEALWPRGDGSLEPGSHVYAVVALRPVGGGTVGRSAASSPVTIAATGAGGATIRWAAVPDATEYRVYVRRPSGAACYWTVSGTSFVDAGLPGTPGAAPQTPGDQWQVKNIFELKNARHVVIEHNLFENNWLHAQPGYAILFTPRNQDGSCTWCVVENVTFQYNVVRNSSAGINLSGRDWPNVSAQTNGIRIRHNLFHGITQSLGGNGWFLLIGDGPRDVVVDHNTVDFDGTAAVYAHGGSASAPSAIAGFQFTNNALRHNQYGINGADFGWGNGVLSAYFPDAIVAGNWLQGGTATRYPAGNYFSGTFASAFASLADADYRLAADSLLAGRATDGTAIGADMGRLLMETGGVLEGRAIPRPTVPGNFRIIAR